MTLPASGAISFSQVNTELGNSSTASLSMSNGDLRALAEDLSGAIAMSSLHGKSAGAIPGSGPSVVYRGLYTDGQSVSLGTASADRTVIFGILWEDEASISVASITLAGSATTNRVTQTQSINIDGNNHAMGGAYYTRVHTTGTSATVNVTFSGGTPSMHIIGVWTMTGQDNANPTDTASGSRALTIGFLGINLNVPAEGAVFAIYQHVGSPNSTAWSGLETPESFDTINRTGGYADHLSADATHAISVNPNGASPAASLMAGMSWR
jgi:hypothetical protein